MAQLRDDQRRHLTSIGREPIDLPAEIHFGGNEDLQRRHCDTPSCPEGGCRCGKARHHLPQYQKTGTYDHPNLVAHRLRVAQDRLDRALIGRASASDERLHGDVEALRKAVEAAEAEYVRVVEREAKAKVQKVTQKFARPEPGADPAPAIEPAQGDGAVRPVAKGIRRRAEPGEDTAPIPPLPNL